MAITDIQYSSRDIEYLERLLQEYVNALIKNIRHAAAPGLTAMQVFDKTAIPRKETGSDFVEYGQQHIDVHAAQYFAGNEVNQEQLQIERKLL